MQLAEIEDVSAILDRHAREVQGLKKKVQLLQQSVPQGDKHAKRKAAEQAKQWEADLLERHKEELSCDPVLEVPDDDSPPLPTNGFETLAVSSTTGSSEAQKPGRTQRRKAAKAKAAQAHEEHLAELRKQTVDQRGLEYQALNCRLAPLQLRIKEVPPDGNCLYHAVADQLGSLGRPECSSRELRLLCSDFMRAHVDDFLPFVPAEELSEAGSFERLCDRVRDTAEWGGQVELQALSAALQRPIEVYTADAPPISSGAQFAGQASLRLSFHRHAYSLGHHYNSVVPAES